MEYCLDTSVYTQAHRTYYAFDLAPGFWNSLKVHAENKIITSPLAAFVEIEKGKDGLAAWAKECKDVLFSEPDDEIVEVYRQIADFTNSHYDDDHWIRDFLDGADPWVIAHAKVKDLTVITMEVTKGSEEINSKTGRVRGKIKIPNMCGHFGVKSLSTFELIRALKISLS